MKRELVSLLLAIFLFSSALGQQKRIIDEGATSLSFDRFAAMAEEKLGIKIYYDPGWVAGLVLNNYHGSGTLEKGLSEFFKGTTLFYNISPAGDVFITRGHAVVLPGIITSEVVATGAPVELLNDQPAQVNAGNVPVLIGNPADRYKAGAVVLSGYITDADTKSPVGGVTVYNPATKAGTMSNEHGFYSISLPRGFHLLRYSFIGMREKQVNVNLYGAGTMDISMKSVLIPIKETVVSAGKNIVMQRFEVGVEKVSVASVKLIPSALGEADILKSVLLMPGVHSVGEGSSGFNVRGGNTDQNLILLYGAPLYNPSHFFGFFPAVNSDAIREATLYKGGIPARYGGRLSSVLEIVPRDGNRKEFAGNAGISPVTTHLTLEGPLKKDTLSFLFNARTTYSNWIFSLFKNPSLRNSRASFYDLNARIVWDPDKKNKFEFSAYTSRDRFRFNSDTSYYYSNDILSFKWRHFFSSTFFSSLLLTNSRYGYEISGTQNSQEAFILSHSINQSSVKGDFNLFKGKHELNFGTELINYTVNPGSFVPDGDSSLVIPDILNKERAVEAAIYADDKVTLTKFLSLNYGVRLSSFFSLGPGTVQIYNNNFPRSPETVLSTGSYGRNKVIADYGGPEVRLSLNFRISSTKSFKINYNRNRQYLHLLSNSAAVSPSDTWKLSDYHIRPQTGDQVAAGFYQRLTRWNIETSAEVYYKKIENMIDFKGGSGILMEPHIEQLSVNMLGKAYGFEASLKKSEGRIHYILGYTYSRTLVRSVTKFPEEQINSGNWFPANFDKPHDLSFTVNYIYSRRISVSSNYTWSTGRPVTFPVATYGMYDDMLIYYSDRNRYRIPDYMRLDVAVKLSGNLRSHRIAHPDLTFSVYNLLARRNVYSVFFREDNNAIKGYRLSVFGNAIPSLTFNFDF